MAAKAKTDKRELRELKSSGANNISTSTAVALAVTVALLGIALWILVVARFR